MSDIVTDEHIDAVMKFRRMYTLLKENEMLIRIGAYAKGTDPELDNAMEKKEAMEEFLSQKSNVQTLYEDTVKALVDIVN